MAKRKTKTPSSIEDKINDLPPLGGAMSALFYGRSGTGKTTIASTFPETLLLIDIRERGTDSVDSDIDAKCIHIDTWEEFEELYYYIQDNPRMFKTVVIDALHTLQDVCCASVLHDNKKPRDTAPSIKDYGDISTRMKKWLLAYRDLRDLSINVIFLAHDRLIDVEENEEDNEILPEVGPRLSPAIASFVTGSVNIVGNTFIRKAPVRKGSTESVTEYCLRLGPNKFYATKIRTPKKLIIPDYIVNPDYKQLLKIIKGEYTPPKTPQSKNPKRALRRRH